MMKKLYLLISVLMIITIHNSLAQVPTISQIVNQINQDSLALYIRQLSGDTSCVIGGSPYTILSRHKNQPGNDKAAQYIFEKFQSWGLSAVYETFSTTGKNVIGIKPGSFDSQKYVVVCAHYDDMPSGTIAPGADDNASGTATVLELARVLSKYNFGYAIRFICFDEEEQGLVGSRYYATQARNRNDSIIAVVNLDMTGYDANNDGRLDVHSKNIANTVQIANDWISNVTEYGISLIPRTVASQPYSDHESFLQKNYGAILVIEYDLEFNPYYHTVNDKFQYLNMSYVRKIAQVTAATIAEYAQVLTSNVATVYTTSGWNLISVPINPQNPSVLSIFPTAVSQAYTYYNGYVVKDQLEVGRGYWLKFNSNSSHNITGNPVSQVQINLSSGWNLIGGLNSIIPTGSIITNPPNIISSMFFEYNGAYNPSNSLLPGKGYWVKATQNGTMTIVSTSKSSTDVANNILPFEYQLTFMNSKAITRLFLTKDIYDFSVYELPPLPPLYLLDARFEGNTFVTNSNGENIIELKSIEFPVRLSIFSEVDQPLLFEIYSNGKVTETFGRSGDEILFNEPVDLIKVKKVTIPEQFIVYQNYPNPFNPKTYIRFNLPTSSDVKLKIFDSQGRIVEDILLKDLVSGLHTIEYNASKLSSGIYIYRIEAGSYAASKKMILMK